MYCLVLKDRTFCINGCYIYIVNVAALTYWDLDMILISKRIYNLSFNLRGNSKDFIYRYIVLPYVASNIIFLCMT
jgi:hypothetical protein